MDQRFENSVQFFHFYWFICCLNFISVLTTSCTTTGSTNPTSTNAVPVATSTVVPNDAVGISHGSCLGVSVVIIGIRFVAIFILSCLYLKKDK